jgi:hypothetical protein
MKEKETPGLGGIYDKYMREEGGGERGSIHMRKLKPIGSAIFLVEACSVRELASHAPFAFRR